MEQLKQLWGKLPSKMKRYVALGGICLMVGALLWAAAGKDTPKQRGADRKDIIKNVLTDTDVRSVGIDGMSARMQTIDERNERIAREMKQLSDEMRRMQDRNGGTAETQIRALRTELDHVSRVNAEMERRITELTKAAAPSPAKPGDAPAAGTPSQGPSQGGAVEDPLTGPANTLPNPGGGAATAKLTPPVPAQPLPPESIFSVGPNPDKAASGAAISSGGAVGRTTPQGAAASPAAASASGNNSTPAQPAKASGEQRGGSIRTIAEARAESEADTAAKTGTSVKGGNEFYLPTGSIISGTLLTGLDAPTGQNARKEPFPALLRVKADAILPNHYRADIRECFLLMGGFGDLSAERAYMRGETISCVDKNGSVVESSFKAYAVGEDGKAGVRGRVVSKQGAMIGKALLAGFADAVGQAFNVKPVPVISTSPGKTQQYQSTFSVDALQGAGIAGASSALDRIAKFYIDMAMDLYPVIEVDAGRKIDMILTQGIKMDFSERRRGALGSQLPQNGGATGQGQQSQFGFPSQTSPNGNGSNGRLSGGMAASSSGRSTQIQNLLPQAAINSAAGR